MKFPMRDEMTTEVVMTREYDYSMWATQGGGLVREVRGVYVFIEKPDCPGLDVGDTMPEEWGIIPANIHARNEMDRVEWGLDDQAMFDKDLGGLFDILFEKAKAGEISYDQIVQCFPQDVQKEAGCYEISNA